MFQIKLGSRVKSVKVTLTNNVKRQHLKGTDPSELEHKTTISASLTRNANTTRWNGELAIPSTWTEGGTRTYERTGAASPKIESNLYTLEVAYALDNGNNCTARFSSEDAFHWVSRA